MWPFSCGKQYSAVPKDEEDEAEWDSTIVRGSADSRFSTFTEIVLGLALAVITILVTFLVLAVWPTSHSAAENLQPHKLSEGSDKTPVRREWRTLSRSEQSHYIDSVHCLLSQPSALTQNSSSYADFPYIHSRIGWHTHHAAAFLPWHRYLLHIYEQTLRSQCGFKGQLVYWDWTLDHEDLASSVVFDSDTGFGGDGDSNGETTVGTTGHCVTDGPFKDVVADYYHLTYQVHCLSRGFHDDEGNLGRIDGSDISPDSINQVLSAENYEAFVNDLESKVHDAIPFGIGGDFETFTAPYDPLFYLHHTQLDRLWWLWQQQYPAERYSDYGGHSQRHSMKLASLDDDINMAGLAPTEKVRNVMNTEGDLLHYRY